MAPQNFSFSKNVILAAEVGSFETLNVFFMLTNVWNLLPGLKLSGFLNSSSALLDFIASLASRGSFPPVERRAVCLVRAISAQFFLVFLCLLVFLSL
jgi:hypothetical protein